jgi:arylsulfatase A-like enzyme
LAKPAGAGYHLWSQATLEPSHQMPRNRHARRISVAILALWIGATLWASSSWASKPARAVVIVTVDTLRADRMSSYGYHRQTSPKIDELLSQGARFSRAWTVEPLTNPALCSMITGLLPHEHGASRNGLRLREGLDSLPKILKREGWSTAAVISNWTLKDKISRLGEHFDEYVEVFSRKRWFGLLNSEATGADVTDEAIAWLEGHARESSDRPFLLWVHYVEPHAPYRFQKSHAERLGIRSKDPSRSDRYDTEIAEVDHQIGRLLKWIERNLQRDQIITYFAADHGESLGEHEYWGHGRYLYEPSLRIPMGFTWPGTIEQKVVDVQARIVDLGPTVLELLGLDVPSAMKGRSWAATLTRRTTLPDLAFCYQAHRGAVHGAPENDRARSKGLLSVGRIDGDRKEIFRVKDNTRLLFDLASDPKELDSLVALDSAPSPELVRCIGEISEGLGSLDRLKTKKLDDETVEQLRALGYLE